MAGTTPPPPQAGRPAPSAAAKRGGGAGGLLMGKYELGRLLGHGNFAKVYHARHAETEENVAIKVLDKEKAVRSGLVPHIKREIAVLRRVRHPNIVQLFEVMATKTKIYFVMELVRGGELFSRVSKGRLREDVARRYFQQLVSAVAFCHARGVFHRDLKPENLLVDENGDLKVSDFGLSAVADQFRPDGLLHTFCGTPAYVAPEVLARRGYDGAKADVWSCGVILFVLMAGYPPFHDKNIMAMYRKIYKGEFRCARWFSRDLTSLLMRILDPNPNTRITLPEVMESRWFKKGFKPVKFFIEDDQLHSVIDDEDDVLGMGTAAPVPVPLPLPPPLSPLPPQKVDGDDSGSESDSSVTSCPAMVSSDENQRLRGSLPRPASLNAFDIISFSRGFNLSGLFEEKGDELRFVSDVPMLDIITKLEDIAKLKSFKLRRKDWRVCLEGTREGVKGPLTIGAEIFELTPPLVMVEVKKKAGDNEEYENFCNKELKPGMQHLVHPMIRAPSIPNDTEWVERLSR
ncbi:CBL-interacting protein kinase 19-like [Phragmites australis]|uniref:CBL-interacting protein kinase 19-like n=1 Tax=Phragmites australis TaxID=29695 RepID=UPI002D780D40|nr:CBL-interacting protein kinase 19-like [Phragmites australis]